MMPFRDYNPSRTFPLVTVSLIVLNTLVFLYMALLQMESDRAMEAFVLRMAVIPAVLTGQYPGPDPSLQPPFLTIFSAMFMHAGPLHLAGNMLYLWIFGNNIEDIMGHGRFLLFYLVCGVIATLAFVLIFPDIKTPLLGASGAVAGVLGAYLVRFPFARVDTCLFFFFVFVVQLPAIIVLGFWFILQLFSSTASLVQTQTGGVAYIAHVGGFLAGMILVFLFARRRRALY